MESGPRRRDHQDPQQGRQVVAQFAPMASLLAVDLEVDTVAVRKPKHVDTRGGVGYLSGHREER